MIVVSVVLYSFLCICAHGCTLRVCSWTIRGGLPAAMWMWERRSVRQTDRTLQLQRRLAGRALWERWVRANAGLVSDGANLLLLLLSQALICIFLSSLWSRPLRCGLHGALSLWEWSFLSSCNWGVPVSARVEGETLPQRYRPVNETQF